MLQRSAICQLQQRILVYRFGMLYTLPRMGETTCQLIQDFVVAQKVAGFSLTVSMVLFFQDVIGA